MPLLMLFAIVWGQYGTPGQNLGVIESQSALALQVTTDQAELRSQAASAGWPELRIVERGDAAGNAEPVRTDVF